MTPRRCTVTHAIHDATKLLAVGILKSALALNQVHNEMKESVDILNNLNVLAVLFAHYGTIDLRYPRAVAALNGARHQLNQCTWVLGDDASIRVELCTAQGAICEASIGATHNSDAGAAVVLQFAVGHLHTQSTNSCLDEEDASDD
jgi:hypothetical protein